MSWCTIVWSTTELSERGKVFLFLYFIPHNIAKTKEKPILEPHKCIDTLIPIKKAALMSHFLFFHYFKEYATEHTEAIYQISQNFLLDLSNKLLSYIL